MQTWGRYGISLQGFRKVAIADVLNVPLYHDLYMRPERFKLDSELYEKEYLGL